MHIFLRGVKYPAKIITEVCLSTVAYTETCASCSCFRNLLINHCKLRRKKMAEKVQRSIVSKDLKDEYVDF